MPGFALGEGDGEGTDTAGEVYSDGVVEMVAWALAQWRFWGMHFLGAGKRSVDALVLTCSIICIGLQSICVAHYCCQYLGGYWCVCIFFDLDRWQ